MNTKLVVLVAILTSCVSCPTLELPGGGDVQDRLGNTSLADAYADRFPLEEGVALGLVPELALDIALDCCFRLACVVNDARAQMLGLRHSGWSLVGSREGESSPWVPIGGSATFTPVWPEVSSGNLVQALSRDYDWAKASLGSPDVERWCRVGEDIWGSGGVLRSFSPVRGGLADIDAAMLQVVEEGVSGVGGGLLRDCIAVMAGMGYGKHELAEVVCLARMWMPMSPVNTKPMAYARKSDMMVCGDLGAWNGAAKLCREIRLSAEGLKPLVPMEDAESHGTLVDVCIWCLAVERACHVAAVALSGADRHVRSAEDRRDCSDLFAIITGNARDLGGGRGLRVFGGALETAGGRVVAFAWKPFDEGGGEKQGQ